MLINDLLQEKNPANANKNPTELANEKLIMPKRMDPNDIKEAILRLGDKNSSEEIQNLSLQILKNASENGQYDDLKSIANNKHTIVLERIHEKLDSKNPEQIIAALEVLGSIGKKESLENILPLVSVGTPKQETYATRAKAVRAAFRIGPSEDSNMIETLKARLFDPSIDVTIEAISGISTINGREKEGVQSLAAVLTSSIRPPAQIHALNMIQNILNSKDPRPALEAKNAVTELLSSTSQINSYTTREDQEELRKLAAQVLEKLMEISK